MSTPLPESTTYYAVYCTAQEDKRPVLICRYEETAIGFCKIYDEYKVPYVIKPFVLETDFILLDTDLETAMSTPTASQQRWATRQYQEGLARALEAPFKVIDQLGLPPDVALLFLRQLGVTLRRMKDENDVENPLMDRAIKNTLQEMNGNAMREKDLEHVSDGIRDLAERGWSVSLEEYQEMRMNSYEREFLVPYLSNDALIWDTLNCLKNCSHSGKATYNYALQELLVPELLERLGRR